MNFFKLKIINKKKDFFMIEQKNVEIIDLEEYPDLGDEFVDEEEEIMILTKKTGSNIALAIQEIFKENGLNTLDFAGDRPWITIDCGSNMQSAIKEAGLNYNL